MKIAEHPDIGDLPLANEERVFAQALQATFLEGSVERAFEKMKRSARSGVATQTGLAILSPSLRMIPTWR
ncbi:MAG: hypothetical protein JSV66_07025 [Trueperaceae bacterium]|nr:MAG: hypothetical protein JSV66_07025 [Trueperaceae bacterium]